MTEQDNTNRPVWDSETEFPELCEKLREGFREISDPEIGLNIIQLGLIRNLLNQDCRNARFHFR